MSASLVAVALSGCAQLFGIENTSAPPDVALPPQASITIERLSIGASLQRNPQDLSAFDGAYYIDDAAEPSGLRKITPTVAGNVMSADVPDGVPAMVAYNVNNGVSGYRLQLAFPNRELKVFMGVYEHPNLEAAPLNASLNVSLTLPTGYATGQLIRLYAIGPWTYHDFAAGELPTPDTNVTAVGPTTIAYDTMRFPSSIGTRPLPKITTADKVIALRYVSGDLTAAGEVSAFELTGGTDMISSTLVAVPHTALDVSVNAMQYVTRLAQTTPTNPTIALNWNVTAAPAWNFANGNGVQLNAGAATMTDTKITNMFGNPFEAYGWKSLFVWNPSRTRTYTPPALNLPVTLYTGLQHFFEPTGAQTVDVQAGLPVLVSVNDQPLTSDGLTVAIDPTKSVKLSMVTDKTGNTYYQYNVYELVPNGVMPMPTALEYKLAYVAQGPNSDIRIPAGILTAGKTYTLRAHCVRGGFPTLPDGDFTNRDLPLTLGYFDSGVFTVAAP